ncbi:MAG TPA: hypothetical protein DCZ95_07870, partial [Verrucomicrobia bacterium]|nr:hypothetical protein [Verrucomicrobiota bacterium]
MRKLYYLFAVAVLLNLLALTSFALDQPGWYEVKGERIPYGRAPSKDSARLSSDAGGMALLSSPDEEG